MSRVGYLAYLTRLAAVPSGLRTYVLHCVGLGLPVMARTLDARLWLAATRSHSCQLPGLPRLPLTAGSLS